MTVVFRILAASVRVRQVAGIAAIGVMLIVGLISATYSVVADARARRMEAAVLDSRNIAYLVRANFERVMESIDLQIDEFVREYGSGRSEEDIQGFFRSRRYPASVIQVAVADASGIIVASNLRYPVEKLSVADREHFRVHADGKATGTFISKPVRGRVSGVWTLNITRALKDGAGRFAGMVVFSYDLADFTKFYDGLDIGRRGIVAMTGRDGFVRVRSGSTEYYGADVSRSPTFRHMLRDRNGRYDVSSEVDRIDRIGFFTTSDLVSLIFLVAYDRSAILRDGAHVEAWMWGGCALLMLLVVAGAAGILREIRRRDLRRQDELQRAVEQRNGALLDAVRSIPGLIMAVAAADGRIVSSNVAQPAGPAVGPASPRAEAIQDEVSGRLQEFTARMGRDTAMSFPAQVVDRFVGAGGQECEIIWAVARLTAAASTEGEGGFIILGLDNTEQRRQEIQIVHMSKLAALGEVATGMAHELNQPLNVIRMAAENALGRTAADAEPAAYIRAKLGRIVAQVERAAKIIDHMRIFGRRGAEPTAAHDPWAAVEGAVNILGEQMRVAGIAVSARGTPGLCRVKCDQALIEQVILNLLLNARDAIVDRRRRDPAAPAAGAIEMRLSVHAEADMTGRVRLSVTDTGGGIPEHVLPRLFEPFFTTKPVGKGTGLGLSVSYGIVRDLEGRLSASNVPDGARFEIDLPCELTREAMPSAAQIA